MTTNLPPMGPNVRKLIIIRLSYEAVPPGGGLGDAIASLINPRLMQEQYNRAVVWVKAVIDTVRTAPDNPYKDDEEIAGAVIKEYEARKKR